MRTWGLPDAPQRLERGSARWLPGCRMRLSTAAAPFRSGLSATRDGWATVVVCPFSTVLPRSAAELRLGLARGRGVNG